MILSKTEMAALRNAYQAIADRNIAKMFRERNHDEVSHLSDDDLCAVIKESRETAVNFGIKQPKLRMRFIMLGVFRLPRFWKSPTITAMLMSKTGSADMRFGDVCTLFKRAADRAGNRNHVWW